jgi:hypothetical protein
MEDQSHEQTHMVEESAHEIGEKFSEFEKFLRKIQIQQKGSYGQKKIFTDNELKEGVTDEKVFLSLVEKCISIDPTILSAFFGEICGFFEHEKVKEMITVMARREPYCFLAPYAVFGDFLTPEERHDVTLSALKEKPFEYIQFYSSKKGDGIFSETEKKGLLLKALRKTNISTDELLVTALTRAMEEGIFSEREAMAEVLSFIENTDTRIKYISPLFSRFTPEESERVKKGIIDSFFKDKYESRDLSEIEDAKELFSEEEKLTIIRDAIHGKAPHVSTEFVIGALPPEEAKAWALEGLRARNRRFFTNEISGYFLDNDIFTEEEKKEFVIAASEVGGYGLLKNIEKISSFFPEGSRKELVRKMVDNSELDDSFASLPDWLPLLSTDRREQKELIKEKIYSQNDFSFLKLYKNEVSEKASPLFTELFNRDEVREIVFRQIDLGVEDLFSNLSALQEVLNGDDEVRKVLDRAQQSDPVSFIRWVGNIGYLYTPSELYGVIEKQMNDRRGVRSCIQAIKDWAPYVGDEYVQKFINTYKRTNGTEMIDCLESIARYVPEEKKDSFVREILLSNPPLILLHFDVVSGLFNLNFAKEEFYEQVLNDEKRFSLAPRSLSAYYRSYRESENSGKALPRAELENIVKLYRKIGEIDGNGFSGSFIPFVEKCSSVKEEDETLDIMSCIVLLSKKKISGVVPVVGPEATLPELKKMLFHELAEFLGCKDVAGDQEMYEYFYTQMGTPTPFLLYSLTYAERPEYKKELSEIFESILHGTYPEHKFGGKTEESLALQKESKLLPFETTLSQYLSWQNDDTTELFEMLSGSADTVCIEVKNIIIDNLEHLGVEKSDFESNGDLAEKISSIGSSLASVNKKFGELGKIPELTEEERKEKEEIYSEKRKMESLRVNLLYRKKLKELSDIKPEEIIAGYFLGGKDGKTKTAEISNVLRGLRAESSDEGRSVFERISLLLEEFKSQGTEKQNLICEDTSDPKVFIEIGEKPVPSCQSYDTGSHNDCLLGYGDPNTKFLILKNEKGNIVARAIFRVLSLGEEGKPALHVERIYSTATGQGVARTIYEHALKKALKLGVPLMVTQDETREGFFDREASSGKFSFVRSDTPLLSHGSRAPKVYVDSAGGERSLGAYGIENPEELKSVIG